MAARVVFTQEIDVPASIMLSSADGRFYNWTSGALEAFNSAGTIPYYKISDATLDIAFVTASLFQKIWNIPAMGEAVQLYFDIVRAPGGVPETAVGTGQIYIDAQGDEMTALEFARYAAAACAGDNSGVGTGVEAFNNLDGTPAFTSTIDTNGNRSVVYH